MRRYPHLYEVNARIFVRRLSQRYGWPLTLATVPDEDWQLLARRGFDLVWLMGVWQRSPGSRQEALLHQCLRQEYDRTLPGWKEEDIAGSPYAVYAYSLDPALGKTEELAELKPRLNRLGLRLVLDFVPNHLALDHPWTRSHPDRFVQGKEADVRAHPDWFFSPGGGVYLAHGRDPYFPPWTDTAQVNFSSTDMRQALTAELVRLCEIADGVRCDMAMLALNDVFERIWGQIATGYRRPETEFWTDAIRRVKERRPDFLFLAEAYWGLEPGLQQLGFDFTYDKVFYDRLRSSSAADIRHHLTSDRHFQEHCVHFIENHDEARAVTALGRERSLAAAAILATVPGLRFFHDGQLEGRRIRLPVQMVREPTETADPDIARFYEQLLAVCNSPVFHEGEWQLLDVGQAGAGNNSHQGLLAWCWQLAAQLKVVAVNYSAGTAQGWLKLPLPAASPGNLILRDELSGRILAQDAGKTGGQGLYLELTPWQACVLDVTPGATA